MTDIGRQLREAREAAGLTLKGLAHLARGDGYSTDQAFRDAESGRRRPSDNLVSVYRKHCDFDPEPSVSRLARRNGTAVAVVAGLFETANAAKQLPVEQLAEMYSLAQRFSRRSFRKPISLDSPERMLEAALYLVLASPSSDLGAGETAGLQGDEIQIVQHSPISAWSRVRGDGRQRLVPNAIRHAIGEGCRVYHTVNAATLDQRQPPETMFERFAELQLRPGDYEFTRDETPREAAVTDTIARPGVGVMHLMIEDPTGLFPTGGDCFMQECAPDYVARRSAQAKQLVRSHPSPFIVHDPSGTYSADSRQVRVEQAMVQLESIRGPRWVIGDGLSDVLAPQDVFLAEAKERAASAAALQSLGRRDPSDHDYWLAELAACHAQRLAHFRSQVVDHQFVDVAPIASIEAMLDRRPDRSRRHIASVVDHLQTYPNYRLVLLEDSLGDSIAGSGIAIIVKQGSESPGHDWQLFFESNNHNDHLSVSFQTGNERYRDRYRPALQRVVSEYASDPAHRNEASAARLSALLEG